MAHPICSSSLIRRVPFVIARSMVPFTATCAAVMGARDAALAKTPRYHPARLVGSFLASCTQILNVIKGTARPRSRAFVSHSPRVDPRAIIHIHSYSSSSTVERPWVASHRSRFDAHALCTHVSTIPPNAPTARFSASESGRLVAIVVVVVEKRVEMSSSVIRLFSP